MNGTLFSIIQELNESGNQQNVEGMANLGITSNRVIILGVPKPKIREIAKKIKTNHELALQLWQQNILEARILASIIADPKKISEDTIESWLIEVDNWDLCDQLVLNLVHKTPFAYTKAIEWTKREEEFVKRAGFALMAKLALNNKKIADRKLMAFFPYILEESCDERRYVWKAISWCTRQIGKRNIYLHKEVINLAEKLKKRKCNAARKIANEVLRELKSEKTILRIKNKEAKTRK